MSQHIIYPADNGTGQGVGSGFHVRPHNQYNDGSAPLIVFDNQYNDGSPPLIVLDNRGPLPPLDTSHCYSDLLRTRDKYTDH